MAGEEMPLTGGNSNEVVRVGSTVRRLVPKHGGSIHALLKHLEASGFAGSPKFLGIDVQGREILGYIEGTAGLHPFSADVRSENAMVRSVQLAREYHDHTVAFVTADLAWPGETVADLPAEVVCHGDLAPYNLIFRGEVPIGIIDFDNAATGSRVEDLANFAYRFAPLSAKRNYADGGWTEEVDRFGRLARILEAYGELDYRPMLDILLKRLDAMCDWIRTRAEHGDPSVAVHLREDHIGIYQADIAWIKANRSSLQSIVGGA